jgi:hypothetical protein
MFQPESCLTLHRICEAAWSFMHSNSMLQVAAWDRTRMLRRQFSRRALRHKPEDEFKDFACWIRRDPGSIAGANYGGMGQGFWDEVDPTGRTRRADTTASQFSDTSSC